jgi:hypothetical protein
MNLSPSLEAAGEAMWALVDRYTGHVRYKGGTKAAGLDAESPVIDCSGWAALLLASGMKAVTSLENGDVFSSDDIAAVSTWSDHMIEVLMRQSGWMLKGNEITVDALPAFATIGLQQGGGAWANNHPRTRGITHVVQLVQRPRDGARFVSEAQGWAEPYGLRLLPLDDWIDVTRACLTLGKAWAEDAFAQVGGSPT